jgi:hypothetical protein
MSAITNHYTLQSSQIGMCDDLLIDAGYVAAEHADLAAEMALAADLAAVDAAYEVMREHGLKTLADRELVSAPGARRRLGALGQQFGADGLAQ